MKAQPLYTSQSKNRKTGNIIQQFIGKSRDESKTTCQGCPLLMKKAEKAEGDKEQATCYSQWGSESWAHTSMIKARDKGKNYSLKHALDNRTRDSKYVRFGVIGDTSGINPETLARDEQTVRDAGLGVLNYTHFWKVRGREKTPKGAHLKGHAMASVDSWDDAKRAVNEGWRAFLHLPKIDKLQGKTEAGHSFTKCPAQRTNNKITCNDCGLCDGAKKAVDIIIVDDH